ncbi:MAG: hypothetical protein ACFFG0_25670 [Candidatus Thorarchaeota archaeon]
MPFTEITSNQFIDGIKKIFELRAFVDIYKNSNYYDNAGNQQIIDAGC